MTTVRVLLPAHLRKLAAVGSEVCVEVAEQPTVRTVLDALEADYPPLRGTIREHATGERRAFMRYYACGEDISLQSQDEDLPAAVADGTEPLRVLGAIAGG